MKLLSFFSSDGGRIFYRGFIDCFDFIVEEPQILLTWFYLYKIRSQVCERELFSFCFGFFMCFKNIFYLKNIIYFLVFFNYFNRLILNKKIFLKNLTNS